MENSEEMTRNSAGLNDETLETVTGGRKKKPDPVGPIPKFVEGQRFKKYWPTSMNWSIIEIVQVTDEYDAPRGFKYIVLELTSRFQREYAEWLEAPGSPWQPCDRPPRPTEA